MRKWNKNAENPLKEQGPNKQNLCSMQMTVFVYFYEKVIWIKIPTSGEKSQKGWTGTLIKFHMMDDRQSR